MHVFMLDAPLTALVAVSAWLILASEDFRRTDVAALAGLTVGLGINVKAQFAQLLAGLVIVVLVHGGWRNRRGFAAFCAPALLVGSPWYLLHFSTLGNLLELAGTAPGVAAGNAPPTFSLENLTWYLWSTLDSQLYLPLFLLAAAGTVWTVLSLVRARGQPAALLEFLLGGFAAWLALTITPHHDIRYGLPLLAFTAVIGTGWIACLPRKLALVAVTFLVVAVLANTLATSFGVGGEVSLALPQRVASLEKLVAYSSNGFLAGGPIRDGDLPGLLEQLHREGVRTVTWGSSQSEGPDFSLEGLIALVRIANLTYLVGRSPEFSRSSSTATLVHEQIRAADPPPCARLHDGTGVWVVRYDAAAAKLALYCPSRRPQFYRAGSIA